MNNKRKVVVFSAGCGVCDETVQKVKEIACESCEIEVLDMQREDAQKRAKEYGINRVPSVVIDGKVADCCADQGTDENMLRAAGLGVSLSE